jgi:hypothetical protein
MNWRAASAQPAGKRCIALSAAVVASVRAQGTLPRTGGGETPAGSHQRPFKREEMASHD